MKTPAPSPEIRGIQVSGKVKKIGVVGIDRRWPNPGALEFNELYNGIGKNTGNLMFTEAVYRLIEGELSSIGFAFDPKMVNQKFDAVIIPAANWINNYTNWDWFTDRLSALEVPFAVVGLGLQAESEILEKVEVNESCRRFVDLIASKPSPISVRGNFTRDWLLSIGVSSVVSTGCPSIYMNMFEQYAPSMDGALVFQGTRYGLNSRFADSRGVNRLMFDYAAKFDAKMIYQSEPEEMTLLTSGASASTLGAEKAGLLAQLYRCDDIQAVDDFLLRNGRVFYALDEWSAFLAAHSAVIGTRLHGSILALNSGRPAMLVPHDSRTAEVAAFAGIQTLDPVVISDDKAVNDLIELISKENLSKYRETRNDNQVKFISYLKDCDLKPRLESFF